MAKNLFAYLLFLIATTLSAQPFHNLVFEGGGIRGIAYAGAIQVLEENNLIQPIDRVAGTSAGAIAALTLALGYNSREIEDIIHNVKLQRFNDGKFLFIGGISRLNRHYGWYRGKTFSSWLGKIIARKTGDADITFREMHERKFKDLYVTGTSLNHQKLIVFSYETYPEMRVKDAVRISMSIPLYFEAVFIDSAGHVKNKKELPPYYDIMVDGGFTGNFPIHIFDEGTADSQRKANPATLGLRIDTPEQIQYDLKNNGLAPVPISRFRNYVNAFYNYVIENLNRNTLTADDWRRTVSISSGDIGPKIKKLSLEEKNRLINNGADAMKNYLQHLH